MRPGAVVPASMLATWVVRALSSTSRIAIDGASEQRLPDDGTPAIFVYWHDQLVLSAGFVRRRLLARGRDLVALTSQSRDGELVARVAASFGVRVVRGSSSHGGREGLRALHRELVRQRASALIIPDGPRGPRHEVKPGVVVLAQLSGAPIVPLGFATKRAWHLRSWDRLAVPPPGCGVRVLVGEPVFVPREIDDATREHYRLGLTSTIADLNDLAVR